MILISSSRTLVLSRALPLRAFSSTPSPPLPQTTIYTGPFTGVTLRLKRVSIFSATVGSIGLPWLIYVTEKTAMAASAVGGTAMLAAVGSTLLLNYCTNPYVHSITRLDGNIQTTPASLVPCWARHDTRTHDTHTDTHKHIH